MKQFIKQAIQNGYTGNDCDGWDWIKDNLSQLDFIFQTEEYKKCNGMNNLCMDIILKDTNFSDEEQDVLDTAWYLNNKREHDKKEKEFIKEMNNDGFFEIANDEKLDGKKIEFIARVDNVLSGKSLIKHLGKLKWSPVDKRLMAMKARHRRRGYWVDNKDIWIKIL